MPAEDTVFAHLYEEFLFWSIIVGIFTFGAMFLFMIRYKEGSAAIDESQFEKIEVGLFPAERHNTKLEAAFYIVPLILVIWVTAIAASSTTAVWGDEDFWDTAIYGQDDYDYDHFTVTVNGKQWFWEFEYNQPLTWEDEHPYMDVEWNNNEGVMMIHAHNHDDEHGEDAHPAYAELTVAGLTTDIPFNGDDMVIHEVGFNPLIHQKVQVFDEDDNLLHTWEHIPIGHKFVTPTDKLVVPCSLDDDDYTILWMHSRPLDDSEPRYVGVQHSFWLPEWGVKEDLVPGLESGTVMRFQPDDAGTFPIRCAEYCGLKHSLMQGKIDIVAEEGETCAADIGLKKESSNQGQEGY